MCKIDIYKCGIDIYQSYLQGQMSFMDRPLKVKFWLKQDKNGRNIGR